MMARNSRGSATSLFSNSLPPTLPVPWNKAPPTEIAVLAAISIRLLWVVMEVAAAGVCYWLPRFTVVRGDLAQHGSESRPRG